jgi:hypothetical protein
MCRTAVGKESDFRGSELKILSNIGLLYGEFYGLLGGPLN